MLLWKLNVAMVKPKIHGQNKSGSTIEVKQKPNKGREAMLGALRQGGLHVMHVVPVANLSGGW